MSATQLYLICGIALGLAGIFTAVPGLRRWLATTIRPRIQEALCSIAKVSAAELLKKVIVVAVFGLAWFVLAAYADRNRAEFTDAAFGSAVTVLAFLLPGAAIVREKLSDEIRLSAKYIQSLGAASETVRGRKSKEELHAKLNGIFDAAEWFKVGLNCAFVAIPVSAASLVIRAPSPGQSGLDLRAVVASFAVTLLVATGIGILPLTSRLLDVKQLRKNADEGLR